MPFCSSYLISHHCRHSLITFYIFIYYFLYPFITSKLTRNSCSRLSQKLSAIWRQKSEKGNPTFILLVLLVPCRKSQFTIKCNFPSVCDMPHAHQSFFCFIQTAFSLNILWQYVHICLLYVFGMFIHVFQFISM